MICRLFWRLFARVWPRPSAAVLDEIEFLLDREEL